LLDGSSAMMVADDAPKAGWFGNIHAVSVVGLPSSARNLVAPALHQWHDRAYDDVSENILPGMEVLYGDMLRQGWTTRTRAELAADDAYHAAPYYRDFRRRIDCDDYVVSIRVVDLVKRPEAITVDRRHGSPRFGRREVAILKLLHDEIAPLIGLRLTTEEHLSRDGLSRRLSQTLSLLLDGKSEKEVARVMGLSPRTVHEYVTALYQHFQVSSRAELLAYFVRRAPRPRERQITR
jgi:DNA-binding CsgD family transcriptional regulator